VRVTGTARPEDPAPVSRYSKGSRHSVKKQTVIDKFTAFFECFFDLADRGWGAEHGVGELVAVIGREEVQSASRVPSIVGPASD
jgi:hypothetical protein